MVQNKHNFACVLSTPAGTLFDGMVKRVTAPTENGEVTVLAHHEPMIMIARAGRAFIETGEEVKSYFIEKGVIEMREDGTLLLLLEDAQIDSEASGS